MIKAGLRSLLPVTIFVGGKFIEPELPNFELVIVSVCKARMAIAPGFITYIANSLILAHKYVDSYKQSWWKNTLEREARIPWRLG